MEKKIFVGKQKDPVAVIKRKEIASYLTDELSEYYSCWSRFNSGFGLPYSANWGDYPDRFVGVIEMMANIWEGVKK